MGCGRMQESSTGVGERGEGCDWVNSSVYRVTLMRGWGRKQKLP